MCCLLCSIHISVILLLRYETALPLPPKKQKKRTNTVLADMKTATHPQTTVHATPSAQISKYNYAFRSLSLCINLYIYIHI